MNVLITGGAGFIGRWVVQEFLKDFNVYVLDNLSCGERKNLVEFKPQLADFVLGDIRDRSLVSSFFSKYRFDMCIHLAAQINVQRSLENPIETFEINVNGTYNLLEEARKHDTKMVIVSTCMVYDAAPPSKGIDENSPLKPVSPYGASKLASDFIAMSYYQAYGLPVVITRPFNTYGPYQKSGAEGGVVSIFLKKYLTGRTLDVFGDGTQTRDFIYVEDCADFILKASLSGHVIGQTINAGSGRDIAIKELALMLTNDPTKIRYVKHPHPQSDISKLRCDYSKAKKLLNWEPKVSLKKGIKKTKKWLFSQLIQADVTGIKTA